MKRSGGTRLVIPATLRMIRPMEPVLPGKTLGILGGGQLGRMFAIAARRLGYRIHCLDPIQYGPTGQIADVEINAAYDDVDAARAFARDVDVVTFEFENVPAETLAAIESIKPVRPSPFVLETTRHRLREKDWLSSNGFPVAPYKRIDSTDQLRAGLAEFGSGILKTTEFGYDGKGQWRLPNPDAIPAELAAQLKPGRFVLESLVKFDCECSVIVARTQSGETLAYDVFENAHERGILDVTVTPGRIDPDVCAKAKSLAIDIATRIGLIGVLCIEMFVVGNDVIVNELAPRPHNSGHVTIDAFVTCQFEQQVRAVCGLPLGSVERKAPAVAMANLLGDLWTKGDKGAQREPNWHAALVSDPRVKLHLYGKSEARPGRKMGHLTATASTPDEARHLVVAARSALLT
jgi:5-(carboxyamino)imidazole ribonucleotide synthase